MSSTPRRLPTLAQIVAYWRDADQPFPGLQALNVDWAKPFCFRCGWRSPSPTPKLPDPTWKLAAGWLERAHLHCRVFGGPDSVENLVPLCLLCHKAMPEFPDGPGEAIAWVWDRFPTPIDMEWQTYTDSLWSRDGWRRPVGFVVTLRVYIAFREGCDAYDVEKSFRQNKTPGAAAVA